MKKTKIKNSWKDIHSWRDVFSLYDHSKEKVEEFIARLLGKPQLDDIHSLEIKPIFEQDKFQYLLFRTKENGKTKVRILRLFRVTAVSNIIREQTNNEEAFKNILINFTKENVSFVVFYAYKAGQNMLINYGLLMEGDEKDTELLIEKSLHYLNSLKRKFRAIYNNIQLSPLTIAEEWAFDCFYYKYVSVVRGIPKPDPSIGYRTGTNPYSNSPMQTQSQVSEIILRGLAADVEEGDEEHDTKEKSNGNEIAIYAVFDTLDQEEIYRLLGHIQETVTQLDSSQEIGMSESENFSIPIIAGMGFGAMTGESNSHSAGMSESVSQTDGKTTGVSTNETWGSSMNKGVGESQGGSMQEQYGKSKNEGGGGTAGISAVVNDNYNWSKGSGENHSISEGISHQKSEQTGMGVNYGEGKGTSNSQSFSEGLTKGNSSTEAIASSKQHGDNVSIGTGVNLGDAYNISRNQKDHFIKTALHACEKYKQRVESGLVEGMFDYRFFILTNNLETKIAAEELVKSSYTNNASPLPIRIVDTEKEEMKRLEKYAKTMAKPKTKEIRPYIPDPYYYSTCVTISEATAFNLPQDNLAGYISSIDPIPLSLRYNGKMKEGAVLGKQVNPSLNVLSSHDFQLSFKQLGHIGFFGGTGQGKTIAVQRFIKSCHEAFDMNFVLFDFTKNHRTLISHIQNKNKFRYNSFKPGYYPLRVNLMVPPPGVPYYIWYPVLAEILCYSMCLGDRSFRIIKKVMKKTKEKAEAGNYTPTMEKLVEEIQTEFEKRQEDYIKAGLRMPFNEQETFASMKERMSEWIDTEHPVYHCMCKEDPYHPFMSIEDMIKGDYIHLIECSSLPAEVQQFVINGITAAIFYYCESKDIKLQKPTYIIFEEAHSVLSSITGEEPLKINETIFEKINRLARNFNLFIGYICQSPEKLPELIFDNMPIRIIFQFPDMEGKNKVISAGGKDPVRFDIDLVKWISRQPQGTCLVRTSNFRNIKDGEFVAVKIDMLPTDILNDTIFRGVYDQATKKTYKAKKD